MSKSTNTKDELRELVKAQVRVISSDDNAMFHPDGYADRIIALFAKDRQQLIESCDAIPDDQPNDIHINFYSTGFKAGQEQLIQRIKEEVIDALENHKKTLDYIVKDKAPKNATNYEVYLRKAIEVDYKIAQTQREILETMEKKL